MNKILKILAVILLCQSCSYEPILINKLYDFKFISISSSGEKEVNDIIKNYLTSKASGEKELSINIASEEFREVVSSDTKGDPKIYKLKIIVSYDVLEDEKIIYKNKLVNQATYNNISDKYELSLYEQNLIKSLSKNISDEILFSIKIIN